MSEGSSPSVLRPCIFVSAVSRELADARRLVANCLRVFHNVDVHYQEDFGLESGKLLAMLRRKIDESAGVLQLVGEAYGFSPPNEDPEFGPVSYTQFEFRYALKQNKATWLIQVDGACTRAHNVAEFVFPEEPAARRKPSQLEKKYRARLDGLKPGDPLATRASDDDDLKRAIAEHNHRRQLQRDYFERQHDHVRGTAVDDDHLKDIIRVLQGLPQVAPRSGFTAAHLGAALDEHCIGRAPLIYDVLCLLDNPGLAHRRVVLHGLGGSGKTTVATEIGHAYYKTGHHVLMVRPVPGRALDPEIASLGEDLGLSDNATAPVVRQWLRSHTDWLMIFDGVDDGETAAEVEQLCDQFPHGHFLITSCLVAYWANRLTFETREVDVLSAGASHRLLRDLLSRGSRPPDPEEDTLAVTALLGGLPLAILHAKGYLENNPGDSIKTYIADLEKTLALPEAGPADFGVPLKPIAATWQASLQRMHPESRTLLRLMSFLTDHPLPLDLIRSPEVAAVFVRACATDPLEMRSVEDASPADTNVAVKALWAAIQDLWAYSLFRWYDSGHKQLRVHRLVLRMTQGSLHHVSAQILPHGLEFQQALASQERTAAVDPHRKFMAHAIRFLTDYLAREGPAGRTRIYPHLFQLASLYLDQEADGLAKPSPLPLAADELNFLGETFSLNGRDNDAVAHFTRAATPQATPYERAKANQGLAWSLFGANRIGEALEHYKIAEQAVNGQPNDRRHDEVRYEIYSGRGWVYRVGNRHGATEDFEKAIECCESSIADFENFDPLDTLAFSHAGLALLGQEAHVDVAVRAYQCARSLASAAGIVDIGRTVFSCFGPDPAVRTLAERLFAGAS